jgi:hypothetical protein
VKSFLRRKFKMSKKLLNEAAVRRFMGLAGMQANMVSNTVTEMYKNGEEGHEEKEEMGHKMEEEAHKDTKEDGHMEEDMAALEGEHEAPVADAEAMADVEDEMMGAEEAPEMEITSEEAEVLANVLQKLMAAKGEAADEPEAEMDMDADIELADDDAVEAEEDEEDAMAMMEEKEEEMNEDEIVQEVARRVAARILKAKKAQKEMNEALGK